eukprot:2933597-Rhodomonas_salina.1
MLLPGVLPLPYAVAIRLYMVAYRLSAYARATRCPVLTKHISLSAYGFAMRCPVLTQHIVLCYAMSGTDIAWLRACYAIPGTETAYSATRFFCYAMSGTELAYGGTEQAQKNGG